MKISKDILGLAAEFAVASELCRRNIYAQLTLGQRKRTDILVETEKAMLRIQVKGKQGKEWPWIKGISGKDILLVFVDFENKKENERPDFYILTAKDWERLLKIEKKKQGHDRPDIKPEMIKECKERWDKIKGIINGR